MNATVAQVSCSLSVRWNAGMPVQLTPCLTIEYKAPSLKRWMAGDVRSGTGGYVCLPIGVAPRASVPVADGTMRLEERAALSPRASVVLQWIHRGGLFRGNRQTHEIPGDDSFDPAGRSIRGETDLTDEVGRGNRDYRQAAQQNDTDPEHPPHSRGGPAP